jgi:hypothetical protein
MQANPNPPKAPDAPLPPTSITTVGSDGKTLTLAIPATADEVAALRARRQELASQLTNVSNRRRELVEQVRAAPEGAARTGLEDRIRLLDQRLIGLETDIAAIGQQLAAAPPNLIASSENPGGGGNGDNFEDGLMIGGGVVLLFVWAYSAFRRFKRRRSGKPTETRGAVGADAARLERLEQGVEAIAIEVERISEGQRFVTRLLSESNPQQVPAQTIKG